jgi:hypothetical protein
MNRAAWLRVGIRSWVAASALALATSAVAAEGWITAPFTPLQLAVTPGYGQLFAKPTPVYGVRASGLYGIQSKVVGVDAGLFNEAEALTGVGVGFCHVVRENSQGAQLNAGCSFAEADFVGLQTSFVNQVGGEIAGAQLGLANSAETGAGLQIGLSNHSHSMRGLQLGLLNWNGNGFLPFFPLFNFGF